MSDPGLVTVFLTATALAMDAFAVSLSAGATVKSHGFTRIIRLPLAFGVFQAAMPLLGAWAGNGLKAAIAAWDHWVAFGLLVLVGGHMIYSALQSERQEERADPTGFMILAVLALATSIDALSVGAGFSVAGLAVTALAAVAGIVTFALSALAVYIGNRIWSFMGRSAEMAGGAILIGIGVRILVSHIGQTT
jgi:putative Mn2+ efflux pump MntP